MKHVWILLISFALLSCSSDTENIEKPAGVPDLETLIGTTWQLTDLNGQDVLPDVPVILDFADSTNISGSGGCNRYFAEFTLSNSKFKLGPIGSTRMMCPADTLQQEEQYFEALQNAKSLKVHNSMLEVACEGYVEPLRFARREKPYDD